MKDLKPVVLFAAAATGLLVGLVMKNDLVFKKKHVVRLVRRPEGGEWKPIGFCFQTLKMNTSLQLR
jgi:hypothetical protein